MMARVLDVNGLRLALGLLTVIPVPAPDGIDRDAARKAMLLAPLAVLPVTLLAGLIGWAGASVGLGGPLAGLLAVSVVALGTRAMHLDGLADTVDGLGSNRPDALEIMRRGDVGPMGVSALILVLGAEILAAGTILGRPWGWLQLAVLLAASRGALALACLTSVPAARPDGLGALVAGQVSRPAAAVLWTVLAGLTVAVAVLAGTPWWIPLAAIAASLLVVAWLVRLAIRRFGGITGDILGAVVELSAAVLLVIAVIRP